MEDDFVKITPEWMARAEEINERLHRAVSDLIDHADGIALVSLGIIKGRTVTLHIALAKAPKLNG